MLPAPNHPCLLDSAGFLALARSYQAETGLALLWVDDQGGLRSEPRPGCACGVGEEGRAVRRLAVEEALRFGEPCINLCPHGRLQWAVPLLLNMRLCGGLFVLGPGFEGEGTEPVDCAALRRHAARLLELVEEANLTNPALLARNRAQAAGDRLRAEAIHAVKEQPYDDIREVYLHEEPALLAAIKRGERQMARQILNRVLLAIYSLGQNRLELLKSFSLELVVMMSRAAVESGAAPSAILGSQYNLLSDLDGVADEEELSHWLTGMLERLIDAIRDHSKYPNTVLLGRALQVMEERLAEDLQRDTVARAVGLSPSHFSHLVREKFGRSFRDLLYDLRTDRARALIARTDKNLVQIALECGFCDQSHFHKHFRKRLGQTPRQYRVGLPPSAAAAPGDGR